MKQILTTLVKSIVTKPEEVSINESLENDTLQLVIHVSTEDIGKVIGKQRKVIRALRNVMKIPAIKDSKRINITIADTEKLEE